MILCNLFHGKGSLHLSLNNLIRLSNNLINIELTTSKIQCKKSRDKTNYTGKFFSFVLGRGRREIEKKVKGRKNKNKRKQQKKREGEKFRKTN